MARTLVVSDLHLGSRLRRDVLLQPAARERLLDALSAYDRLVLLGDTVEMLEGRPKVAMRIAEPVLRAIGDAAGRSREVVLVPGNHDHRIIRPWLRGLKAQGKRMTLSARVSHHASPELEAIASWLKPARVRFHYPGLPLAKGVWATHGHYLDRHLVPMETFGLPRPLFGSVPETGARPEDYEAAVGPSIAALQGLMATSLPTALGEPIDRAAGIVRRSAMAMLPLAAGLGTKGRLAPLSAGVLGYQFRRAGLPAMGEVAHRLRTPAKHVVFGHVHRLGIRPGDEPAEWLHHGRTMHNTGCWVYEPLLLAGAEAPHPYWPGGAVVVEDGEVPRAITLLDDVDPRRLLD